jgi:hypothetical protein
MKLKNIGYVAFIAATATAFVIGSGGPSQAKHKTKMEAPPPQPVCFPMSGGPVCGTRGGMKFTYANSCYAAKDGAKVVSDQACPAKSMTAHKKHAMAKPAMKKDEKKKM